jgi:hypothetical protein
MRLEISSITLFDVIYFSISSGCDLFVQFSLDHSYKSINDIEDVLKQIGIFADIFCFKGVSSLDFDKDDDGKFIPRKEYKDNEETSILCEIPEHLIDKIMISAYDSKYGLTGGLRLY